MKQTPGRGFLLPRDFDAEKLAAALGGPQRCDVAGSATLTLTFFDSFDWRLAEAGLQLMFVEAAQGRLLRLEQRARGGGEIATTECEQRPAWPADLPDGAVKDRVVGRMAMRVLLPVVRVRCRTTELRVLNEDAKSVARLQLLAMHCDAPDLAEARALSPRVRLLPVRGYEPDCERLARTMADEMEWPPAPESLFDEALAAVGRDAGDYTSKLNVPLQPQQLAVDATRTVLLTLLDTIERNVPGARANLDSEFLHDLRVATRRTRSALSQVKRVLPDTVVEEFKQRFAWLGQITGPTRDLDVFLLELPHYRAMLPLAMAGDLDALEQHLRKTHATVHARLKRQLGSAEMKALLHDWRSVLEADAIPGEPGWFADLPIERVASARIWRMFRKVIKAGRAVTRDGPAEEMHELRKDCKKLRYLIEFFRGVYPADELKGIIRALKDLLDNLGEFQDLEVQAGELRDFARRLDTGGDDNLATVLAIGALVADLLRRQQAAHERFAGRFAAFDSDANRADFKRLFRDTR